MIYRSCHRRCYRYIRRTKTRMYGNSAKFCARVCLSARERRDGNKSTSWRTLPGRGGEGAEEGEDAQTARLGARPGRTEPISLSIPLHHVQRDGHLCKLDRAIASDIMPKHRFSGSGGGIRPRRTKLHGDHFTSFDKTGLLKLQIEARSFSMCDWKWTLKTLRSI